MAKESCKSTPNIKLGDLTHTHRGFELIEFKDHYGTPCSLHASSLAENVKPGTSAVWLGTDDADPKVLAKEAHLVGVDTLQKTGWVPYHIPECVSLTTHMHLNRTQVVGLISHLISWLETDSFVIEDGGQIDKTPSDKNNIG